MPKPYHRPGSNAEPHYLTVDEAEEKTKIRQDTASRWHKALQNVPKYRARIIAAGFRKALLEAEADHRAEGTGEMFPRASRLE